jgi:hypothetical protein
VASVTLHHICNRYAVELVKSQQDKNKATAGWQPGVLKPPTGGSKAQVLFPF